MLIGAAGTTMVIESLVGRAQINKQQGELVKLRAGLHLPEQ